MIFRFKSRPKQGKNSEGLSLMHYKKLYCGYYRVGLRLVTISKMIYPPPPSQLNSDFPQNTKQKKKSEKIHIFTQLSHERSIQLRSSQTTDVLETIFLNKWRNTFSGASIEATYPFSNHHHPPSVAPFVQLFRCLLYDFMQYSWISQNDDVSVVARSTNSLR